MSAAILAEQAIRILIVDDHAIVRSGLRMLIESRDGYRVVAEASTVEEALAAIRREEPEMILLDLDLGGESSVESVPDLLAAAGAVARLIVLTGLRDASMHQRAVELGAAGVVRKERAPEILLKAIDKVHDGELWLDRALMSSMLSDMSKKNSRKADPEAAKIAQLTPREREVIAVVAEGLRNRQVGERLFISEITVRHHLSSIFAKLELSDRLELIIYAYRHGLAKPPQK